MTPDQETEPSDIANTAQIGRHPVFQSYRIWLQ